MTHLCTAVVVDPNTAPSHDPLTGDIVRKPEMFVFEVAVWYEALDVLCTLWAERFPLLRHLGVDHLEVRAISIIRMDD